MRKSIFITGGTGLVGRAIVQKFCESNYAITALKRKTSRTNHLPESVHYVEADLLDIQAYEHAIQQADLVIHCAAIVDFHPKNAQHVIEFNVASTTQIVNACIEHQKPLIFISSIAALGDSKGPNDIVTEESEFQTDLSTAYALSKYLSEMEVWRGIAEGIKAIIVNPGVVLGLPSEPHESSGVLWQNILKYAYYPDGSTGFVDARDVATCIYLLNEQKQYGHRFILVADHLTYTTFFEKIKAALNINKPSKQLPKSLSKWVASLISCLQLLGIYLKIDKTIWKTLFSHTHYSNQKVKEAIAIQFRPIDETISWVSSHYKK